MCVCLKDPTLAIIQYISIIDSTIRLECLHII